MKYTMKKNTSEDMMVNLEGSCEIQNANAWQRIGVARMTVKFYSLGTAKASALSHLQFYSELSEIETLNTKVMKRRWFMHFKDFKGFVSNFGFKKINNWPM